MLNEERDKKAMELMREKYKDVDVAGSVYTLQIFYVSERFCKKLGYTKEEMEGKLLEDFFVIDPEAITLAMANLYLGQKEDVKIFKTKSGETVTAKARIETMTYEDEPYVAACDIRIIS